MALYIVKPWYKKEEPPTPALIYGAEWAGGSSPAWTRTDAAANFADPNPYYSGMSGAPSSPFDDILPWSGLRRVTDSAAGELVEIPKFYYKWTRDGVKMKLQISMSPFDGSYVSPAHADRGDGVGERDYVYIGRYHCASDYKSKSGFSPINNISIATARSAIHQLNNYDWILDYASLWTIRMLYLVEYANWDCQAKIGLEPSGQVNTGGTDNMPYHTGTMASARTTLGNIQYRYIENLWGNIMTWVDGIYVRNYNIYNINNPADFSASSGGVNLGTLPTPYTYYVATIIGFNNPTNSYALMPIVNTSINNYTTYVCAGAEHYVDGTNNYVMYTGSDNGNYRQHGLFFTEMVRTETEGTVATGSRLMVLPPNRLSA